MTAIANYRNLWRGLTQREFARAYLFYGDEEGLIAQAALMSRREFMSGVDDGLIEMNSLDLSSAESGPGDIRAAVLAGPVFSDRKTVFMSIRDVKRGREQSGQDAAVEELLEILPTVPAHTLIIAAAGGLTKGHRLVKAFSATGQAIAFPALSRQEAQDYLAIESKRLGITLDRMAQHSLLDTLGVDGRTPVFRQLRSELGKLAAWTGYSGTVTREDISALVANTAEARAWDLTDALSNQNPAAALSALQRLWRDDYDPVRVVATVSSHCSVLLLARRCLDSGLKEDEIIKSLTGEPYRLHSFPAGKAVRSAARFPAASLAAALNRCVETDYLLKSTSGNPVVITELLVRELAQIL